MNKFLKIPVVITVLFLMLVTVSSCKKNFDQPPTYVDPQIVANTSIATLKAKHTAGGFEVITTDLIISGTVIADDKSGNLYKEIYIKDATGGLDIKLEGTNLYTAYPIGRKIYIKCKGLYLSDYAGMIQIGVIDNTIPNNPSLAGIPYTLFDTYIARGTYNNPVVATPTTVAQLSTNIQNVDLGTLIKLDGYEFSNYDVTRTFADTSSAKNSFDLFIKSCSGSTIDVRTSGYANFAGSHPPSGNGSIIALYTQYNGTKQLVLRDPTDINFTGNRCAIFEEDFGSLGTADNNQEFTFPGWSNIAPNATAKYKNTVFGSSGKAVKVTAFGTSLNLDTAWLITPAIAIPGGLLTPKLFFSTSFQFAQGPTTLHAFISTNYIAGGNPNSATWTQLTTNANIPGNTSTTNSSTFSSLTSTGALSLTSYVGQTVFIAFKYMGGLTGAKTTTFEIDDINVTRQ